MFSPAFSRGADPVRFSEVHKLSVPIYSTGGAGPVAVVRAEKVFSDKRRLGFFRVRLLPVLVAQGVRLEINHPPDTNWLASFRVNFTPLTKRRSMEWRDFTVWLPGETSPRLAAQRLYPPTASSPETCRLEDMTLQTDAGSLKAGRARLLLAGSPGLVVWESAGETARFNLLQQSFSSANNKN